MSPRHHHESVRVYRRLVAARTRGSAPAALSRLSSGPQQPRTGPALKEPSSCCCYCGHRGSCSPRRVGTSGHSTSVEPPRLRPSCSRSSEASRSLHLSSCSIKQSPPRGALGRSSKWVTNLLRFLDTGSIVVDDSFGADLFVAAQRIVLFPGSTPSHEIDVTNATSR